MRWVVRICFWAVAPGDAREVGTNPRVADNKGTMRQVRGRVEGQARCTLRTAPLGWDQGATLCGDHWLQRPDRWRLVVYGAEHELTEMLTEMWRELAAFLGSLT